MPITAGKTTAGRATRSTAPCSTEYVPGSAGGQFLYSCESIERGRPFSNLLGYDVDNEMDRRLVDFAETAVDLVLGELKNNVVQLGTDGDETIYQVRVARSQIPTLLNAGLSLFVYDNVGVPVSRFSHL